MSKNTYIGVFQKHYVEGYHILPIHRAGYPDFITPWRRAHIFCWRKLKSLHLSNVFWKVPKTNNKTCILQKFNIRHPKEHSMLFVLWMPWVYSHLLAVLFFAYPISSIQSVLSHSIVFLVGGNMRQQSTMQPIDFGGSQEQFSYLLPWSIYPLVSFWYR